MALRYLIYSTGTTYAGTIIRESLLSGTTSGEARYLTNFVIPQIQPLHLWRVNNVVTPSDVIVNTDANIYAYENSTAPPPTPQDLVNYGQLTGATSTKIDKVTGHNNEVPIFTSTGDLQSGGYTLAQLTGKTTYTFTGSGGTNVSVQGNHIIIESTPPSGTTVSWGDIYGNIANQPDLSAHLGWLSGETALKLYTSTFSGYTGATKIIIDSKLATVTFSAYTGTTKTKIDSKLAITTFSGYTGTTKTQIDSKIAKVSGVTNQIAVFTPTGTLSGSSKQLTNTVRGTGSATNGFVPSEYAVRDAINSAIAAAIILQGDWNATTNTPNLTVTGITTGYAWRVSTSGTTTLGGITPWYVGDMAVKSAGGWIRINNQDIAALWGNISGTLSNQTDLWTQLTAITASIATKLSIAVFSGYTGTTKLAIDSKLAIATFSGYTGTTKTKIDSKLAISTFSGYTGTTKGQIDSKLAISTFSGYTGTTKTKIDSKLAISTFSGYTGTTKTEIDSKLATAVFTGYTASTKNVDKKIQVVWTGGTTNANVVTPLELAWSATPTPYATDIYSWTGGSAVWLKSAGSYELQYHVVFKNDASNQSHSIGAYILKNGEIQAITAGAGMAVGIDASGEISVPPVVLTLANNDRLDLAVFRIGVSGNANLVSGSVFLTLNKLT